MGEHACGIGVAPEHHVAEADVVVGVEMGGHDAREHGLLVHLDVVERLEREREVAQQAVNSQKADDGEVSKHAVEWSGAVVTCHTCGFFASLLSSELLIDLGALNERIQDVEDGVAAPSVWVVS